MRFRHHLLTTTLVVLMLCASQVAAEDDVLYRADFEETEIGEVPDDFLVLEGEFAVEEVEGNKQLALPGQPVNTFSALFGPAETEGVAVQARFKAEAKKRRYSNFAIGLSGISGYRLQINPTRRLLELYREDTLEASASYKWKQGEWTFLELRVRKLGESQWRIEGKAWNEGEDKPVEWAIAYEDSEEPHSGRPSIWGIPFAEKPIWFDDIQVMKATD